MQNLFGKIQLTTSSLALVVANLTPLVGVFWFGWDAFSLVLLFWLENVIIGIFNALRMVVARKEGSKSSENKFIIIPFFVFHYGFFTLAQGVLLFAIFGKATGFGTPELGDIPVIAWQQIVALGLAWSLLALVFSHGVSFATNTIAGGEYRRVRAADLMGRPYGRVVIMQLTVLVGAVLAQMTGSNRWALVVLVIAKLVVDLKSHKAERMVLKD